MFATTLFSTENSFFAEKILEIYDDRSSFRITVSILIVLVVIFLNYFVGILFSINLETPKLQIICMSTKFNNYLRKRLLEEVGPYIPPWWYNRHAGTIISFGADLRLNYKREIFAHGDGSLFAVDWFPDKPNPNSVGEDSFLKICVIVPGLGGNSDTVS